MKKEEWEQIEEIVDRALELQGGEKTAYIRQTCGHNKQMLQKVEELLEFIDSAELDQFLETPDQDHKQLINDMAAGWNVQTGNVFKNGDKIGLYEITGVAGSGGMGTVYKARRADGTFQRDVAVKVIRRGMETEENVRRFSLERKLLASLDHPNIARLLDGGLSADGLSYLIMEFIDGKPIDEYCIEHKSDIKIKLNLFLQVCSAVQFAHSKLIIHRDIKPKNIFVTDAGIVKVLDFGIAKLLDDDQKPIAQTQTGKPVLTPEYAAPEQFSPEQLASTSMDVYSLGLILFEILTGTKPFDLSGKSIVQIERMICEDRPPKPSSRISSHSIDGDLDIICLKALRKEPGERYGTVQELLDDIKRYLKGQPITARPASLRYRIRKFTGRNKAGVSVAVMVIFLVGFFISLLIHQQEITAAERDRAVSEAEKAVQVTNFLKGIFEISDPNRTQGEQITARQLLDEGATRLETELAGQPLILAEMSAVVADIYTKLGEYDAAIPLFERSLELRILNVGPTAPATGRVMSQLGKVQRWSGNTAISDSLLYNALAILSTAPDEFRTDQVSTLREISAIQFNEGNIAAADSLVNAALEIERIYGDPESIVASGLLTDLGVIARNMDDLESAESYMLEALRIRQKHLSFDNLGIVSTRRSLALLYHQAGRWTEAEEHYREVLEAEERIYEGSHPSLGRTLNSLGSLLSTKGSFDEAEIMFKRSLAMAREQLGADHQQIATILTNYGNLLRITGRLNEALSILQEAQEMHERIFGTAHRSFGTSLSSYGLVLRDLGRYDEALNIMNQVEQIYLSGLGSNHRWMAVALRNKASVLLFMGDFAAADSVYQQSNDIQTAVLAPDHPNRASFLIEFGEIAILTGRFNEARNLLDEAMKISRLSFDPEHWKIYHIHSLLGANLSILGELDEGERFLSYGLKGLTKRLGENSIYTMRAGQRMDDHQKRILNP